VVQQNKKRLKDNKHKTDDHTEDLITKLLFSPTGILQRSGEPYLLIRPSTLSVDFFTELKTFDKYDEVSKINTNLAYLS
jgi:hypothetical protein